MTADKPRPKSSPWAWVPTLYLAQGLPFAIVNSVSIIIYKSLGISNADIAFYTAWLYLPWVIKPLWSPVVDILRTRRWWIWAMQLLMGAGFAGIGLTLPTEMFFKATLVVFYLIAFASATHDIAADGYYLLATTEKEQAFFVGIRSTFFRISMVTGQGLLVIVAGLIQTHSGLPAVSLNVEAKPGVALVQTIKTNLPISASTNSGELRVIVAETQIQIAPEPRPKAEVNGLLAVAKNWNLQNGFSLAEKTDEKKTAEASWWSKSVSQPFADFLKQHFGRTAQEQTSSTGNIGLTHIQLSQPPGREIVVMLVLDSGDKSISVAEGARLIFNDSNWNKTALAVLQLDPKLKTAENPPTHFQRLLSSVGVSSISAQRKAIFEIRSGNIAVAWATTFFVLVGLFAVFGLYHRFLLPHPVNDQPGDTASVPHFIKEFFRTFGSFFAKPKIVILLLFLLLYRFGEAQLVKMVVPFLLDGREVGGLGLTTGQVGWVYGTIGIVALTIGGLLGGFVASKFGLKAWLWAMVCIIHLPDAVFIYLASVQPDNLALISAAVAVEQFGYGFGFTAYMLYMIYIARGKHQTAHYAICTGFMALGMMIPGMWSGWLQEIIGYQHFFQWVILATIPSFIVVLLIPLDKEFGKKG